MTMASKKATSKKATSKNKARLRDLPRTDKGQEELSAEQARNVKGGAKARDNNP
jgi:hypothetical protein